MLPANLLADFPDDYQDLLNQVMLTASLADQLGDTVTRRNQNTTLYDLENQVVPGDVFLNVLRTELIRQREDFTLLANTLRSLESNQQVTIAKMKNILGRIEKLEKKKKKNARPDNPPKG